MKNEPDAPRAEADEVSEPGWLRQRADPRVLQHLQAENEYCAAILARSTDLCQEILAEISNRSPAADTSVPVSWGPYQYFTRQEAGRPYLIHCRRQDQTNASEEVLLDENELAENQGYCSVRSLAISPNHRLLAFTVDWTGDERYQLQIRDLEEGSTLYRRSDVGGTVVWARDSRNLFYTILDLANRPHKIYRYFVSNHPTDEVMIYHEKDEVYHLALSKTECGGYLSFVAKNPSTTEVWLLNARAPFAQWKLFQARRPGVRYALTHLRNHFYILTNKDSPTFRLFRSGVPPHEQQYWQELPLPQEEVHAERITAFTEHLVLFARQDGCRRVWVRNILEDDASWNRVGFPEEISTVYPESNREFQTTKLRLGYSSLTTPYSVFDYDMQSQQLELQKEAKVHGDFNKENYDSKRITATTASGVAIPISLVYRRDQLRDDGNPLILYAYGAYGYCLEPEFDATRLSLLDRGVIFAVAHVRGGGELGKAWHDQGRLSSKKNSFDDFIACAEHLIRKGYTTQDQLGILGESAGGLLLGAVLNERPDLFTVAVADCPFVDVLNTLLDPTLPLSTSDWQEFGDPREKETGEYIASYSPYENVRRQAYPAIYATAGFNDPRVSYWEPAKWALRLREYTTGERPVLLEVNPDAGHWGSSERFGYFKETARKYAFLLHWLT